MNVKTAREQLERWQLKRAGRQQLAWALGLEDRITRPLDATDASLGIR